MPRVQDIEKAILMEATMGMPNDASVPMAVGFETDSAAMIMVNFKPRDDAADGGVKLACSLGSPEASQ